ncbi:hypothetical protein WR25_04412 [Diploscapter pachys]|uniref:Helicase C-terminal domain-containing protein n=1 Tax=Diploscapter pachys TaxID=2018661 RepID=A0A2A2J8J9_9BILA|nr:hypothetical protein WR25_04412 [Diploscapter pachys]
MKEILSALPKQRRSGLFSATQAKEQEDLGMFMLREPKFVKLQEAESLVQPTALNNFYTVMEADQKLMCCVDFIRQKPDKKFLVFFPSCACVQYFHMILKHVLTKRPLLAVHGKNSLKQRSDQIAKFASSSNGVMLSTDVMSRGIDIADIDWVVQFEIPKASSWFVHRTGRTGRQGREGNALLLLANEQAAYVEFVSKHEKVILKEIKVKSTTVQKAEELRQKIQRIIGTDRGILEAGSKAFVTHIESYIKHDCNIVCSLKELNVPGLAHAYGILRLPKMRELSGRADLDKFKRSDVDTSTIKYANEKMESQRKGIMEKKHEKKVEFLKKKAAEKKLKDKRKMKKGKGTASAENGAATERADGKKNGKVAVKRKATSDIAEEVDDFEADARLMRKMKKGKLRKKMATSSPKTPVQSLQRAAANASRSPSTPSISGSTTSEDADLTKRVTRFAVEVWNLTQNWLDAVGTAASSAENVVNRRLQLMYAKDTEASGSQSGILTKDERLGIYDDIVREVRKVDTQLDRMQKIIGKFGTAQTRADAYKQMIDKQGNAGRKAKWIVETLNTNVPLAIEMYSKELESKRLLWWDVGRVDSSALFSAAILSFKHEPFVNSAVITALYSLVVLESI